MCARGCVLPRTLTGRGLVHKMTPLDFIGHADEIQGRFLSIDWTFLGRKCISQRHAAIGKMSYRK